MKHIRNWWQKLFGFLALCLLIVIGISACNINTTPQSCDGVVNVNSCTSSNNISIQATVQAKLNATATSVATVQNTIAKDEKVISVGIIIIPLALFLSIIALLFSLGQDATTPKVTLGIVTVLLAILTAFAIYHMWF